ncbi:MAG: hypothetical protein ACP5GI_07200 [Sulfolobales archaeon]
MSQIISNIYNNTATDLSVSICTYPTNLLNGSPVAPPKIKYSAETPLS